MNLSDLLSERRKKYFKKLSRYTKYIFNDHFVIVMLFLLGALAFQYTEFVKTVEPPFAIGKVIWALLLSVFLFFGKLTTLVQPADAVFLTAKETEWHTYLKRTKPRSMIVPGFFLFDLLGIAMPMLFIGEAISAVRFLVLAATLFVLKWAELTQQERSLRLGAQKQNNTEKSVLFVLSFIILLLAFFVTEWLGLVFSLLVAVGMNRIFLPLLDWERLVQTEENRTAKINRVINLFTDVPTVKNHAKRRKYLDGAVKWLGGEGNPYQYLFARAFIRGGNYGGLYMRLTIIGILLFSLTDTAILSILLNALFLYLTGFQLIALYGQLDEHVLVRLYPVRYEEKRTGFGHMLLRLSLLQSFLFSIATVVGSGWLAGLAALGINILFSWLFVRFYMRNRTKKADKWAF